MMTIDFAADRPKASLDVVSEASSFSCSAQVAPERANT